MPQALMVGFSKNILTRLEGHVSPGSVVVLEEPDVFAKKNLGPVAAGFTSVAEVVLGAYQQSDEFLDVAIHAHERWRFEAVFPGIEYGVVAAATVAEALGLPGATRAAASVLCDKLRLREVSSAGGVRNPTCQEITGPADLESFASGRSVVIKPANRQASLGVQFLDAGADLSAAWNEMVSADEPQHVPDRRLSWRYLAEERLAGEEYSVEALVDEGQIVFQNVTKKTTVPGPYPVELAHVVPARLDDVWAEMFRTEMRKLLRAVRFGTGMVHAEWIVDDLGPALIECAGRAPGDSICDLIDLAYGSQVSVSLISLLAGRRPLEIPRQPRSGAAIRFLSPTPGQVVSIDGVPEASRLAGVEKVHVAVTAGDTVNSWRSSWDRNGFVIATAAGPEEAAMRAQEAARRIRVVTTTAPVAESPGPRSVRPSLNEREQLNRRARVLTRENRPR